MVVQFIRKDLILLVRPISIIAAVLIAVFFGVVVRNVHYGAVLISLMLVFVVLFQDVRYKTDTYMISLPIKRTDVVLARYLEGIIFSVFGLVITWICTLPFPLIDLPTAVSHVDPYATIGLELLMFSVFFPFHHRFGGALTYVSYFVLIGFDVFSLVNPFVIHVVKTWTAWMPEWTMLIAVFLLYCLSYWITLRIFKKIDI